MKTINKILYYSNHIDIKKYEDFFADSEIEVEPIKEMNKPLFNDDHLNLFLLEEKFYNKPRTLAAIRNNAAQQCVILISKKTHNSDEEPIISYLYDTDNSDLFIKSIENGFYRLQLRNRVIELEKKLIRTEDELSELQTISIALSTEKNISNLIKTIIKLCMEVTMADAGAVYLVEKNPKDENKKLLRFMLNENHSLKIDSVTFTMPLDKTSLAGYAACTKEILNIPDSYKIEENVEYNHSKKFDQQYKYFTKSILTFPMINHKDDVIGVVQLINKRNAPYVLLKKEEDFDNIIPFNQKDEIFVSALASQAAIALDNAILYDSIQKLFEGFVMASVQAIESRDPTTSGHSERVAIYSVELAKAVSKKTSGVYKDIQYNDEEIKELRYASLLHDFGEVGVRECVLQKEKKLEPIQLEMFLARINFVKKNIYIKSLNKKLEISLKEPENLEDEFEKIDQHTNLEIDQIELFRQEVFKANEPTVLHKEEFDTLKRIKDYTFISEDDKTMNLLTDDEYLKLCISKGSLDQIERVEMESHVTHSFEFLKEIPWTSDMKNIPEIAFGHHEKLDGSGYPRGLKEEDINLKSKIMTIADIYDALTASDRPYKKAMSIEKALEILKIEVANNHVDKNLLDIFIEDKIYKKITTSFLIQSKKTNPIAYPKGV